MDDWQLLRRFVEHDSQEAFAALTKRYLGLVYSVCRREVADAETAEDVTQAVFLLLARKAPTLRRNVVLSGWLFQTARFAAKNARTRAQRRAAYEQKAAELIQQQVTREDAAWAEIEPVLNQSLAALWEGERESVLLRFFQGMSFAETGTALSVSEEAARKRVTRALEKMRRFFGQEGIVVPGAALAALLSTHAARVVPAQLMGETIKTLAGSVPGHVSLISQGVLQSMRLFKLKAAAGAVAVVLTGATALTMAHGTTAHTAPAKPTVTKINLDAPVNDAPTGFSAPGEKDAVLNVTFVGKVRYADGKPAGAVEVAAKIQNAWLDALSKPPRGGGSVEIKFSKKDQMESWNNTVSKPDGSYELPVGANIPYNVMVFDTTGKWVAAALEGKSSAQNSTVNLPDLVLTRGALVVGRVTKSGVALPRTAVQSYGPHRPATTAATSYAYTDLSGHYRLRVAPGISQVYVASGAGNASRNVTVSAGEIKTVDLVTP
jgi:RNA polymerase sigma factor (sigma-70 family)